MDKLSESAQLPIGIGAGPHTPFLTSLVIALRRVIEAALRRINETAPKDGSEQIQMQSWGVVTFPTMVADVDNADPGYFAVVKFILTGSDHTLSGIVDGAGQEGVGGRVITLVNASATALNLIVSHEDIGSLAANQFVLPRGFSVTIGKDMAMSFWYDLAALRWRMV